LTITSPPTAAHEWRLVLVSGVLTDVHKLGDRWRAELSVGRDQRRRERTRRRGDRRFVGRRGAACDGGRHRPAPVPGRVGSALVGRAARAGRRRSWERPRRQGAAGTGATDGSGGSNGPGSSATGTGSDASGTPVPDVDLANLGGHVGETVRVGGLVAELAADGFTLDDGTAIGRVVLTGEAADYLPLIDPGDALNATGRVEKDGEEPRVVVTDAAGLVRVGDLTAATAPESGGRWRGRRHDGRRPGSGPEPARRRVPGAGRAGDRRRRRNRRDQRPFAGRHDAPPATGAAAPGGPGRGPSGGRRRALGGRPAGLSVGLSVARVPCWAGGCDSRSSTLDARSNAGLSSAEFRACEAAT
jgi:hypothetical protein